jgi:hypothetical protein
MKSNLPFPAPLIAASSRRRDAWTGCRCLWARGESPRGQKEDALKQRRPRPPMARSKSPNYNIMVR